MTDALNIVWLRRDLRLHDHAVLARALEERGMIQPVFVLDTEILARFPNREDRRLSFIARQLASLHKELNARGGGLLVLHGEASTLMPKLCAALKASHLVAARDAEPQARARDKAVYAALNSATHMIGVWDHLLLSPEKILREDGSAPRVFTPYFRRWQQALNAQEVAERKVNDKGRYADFCAVHTATKTCGITVLDASDPAALLKAAGYSLASTGEWKTEDVAHRTERFADKLGAYPAARDMLAEDGTSKLSPYLRFGLISTRECARLYLGHHGAEKWLSELAWRDFYAMILYHHPEAVDQEYQARFRGLAWRQDEARFARWQEGMTGYPVVDAAMRQLRETGWMHNRARMIVASFLTKDLLIDWRRGEEHFAQHLMDYDLASNNGGWQWAASTGTDAQPWFRVFNPVLQGKKFDPEGDYVRQYVLELTGVEKKYIHEPWKMSAPPKDYPARIVEHHVMRLKALAMFKEAK